MSAISTSRGPEDVTKISNSKTEDVSKKNNSRFSNFVHNNKGFVAFMTTGMVASLALFIYARQQGQMNDNIHSTYRDLSKSCDSMHGNSFIDCMERADRASQYCFSENETCIQAKDKFHWQNIQITLNNIADTLHAYAG